MGKNEAEGLPEIALFPFLILVPQKLLKLSEKKCKRICFCKILYELTLSPPGSHAYLFNQNPSS